MACSILGHNNNNCMCNDNTDTDDLAPQRPDETQARVLLASGDFDYLIEHLSDLTIYLHFRLPN